MKPGGKNPRGGKGKASAVAGTPNVRNAPGALDADLWHAVAKTVVPLPPQAKRKSVAALKGKAKAAEIAAPKKPAAERKPAPRAAPIPVAPQLPPLAPQSAPGLDARTHEKFRRGQLPIDASIDLHGYTLEEAHRALGHFVEDCYGRGKRCLLVITGKGAPKRPEEEFGSLRRATLRESVPKWLNEPNLRPRILAIAPAQAKHGGVGALYVLLKRQRA